MAASKSATRLIVATSAILLACAIPNRAQNEASVSFHSFQDSRGVNVQSPDFSINHDLSDRTALRLKFGVDAISAASDSCARCHQDGANNSRVSTDVGIVRKMGDTKLTIGGQFGRESFYQATTALTSISRDLNAGNTTVAAGASFSLNQPVLHPSEQTEQQQSYDVFGSITQSWTKGTVTQFGYELNQVNGYQSNPFLRTRLNGQLTVGVAPDARTRHALSARLRQALPLRSFLEADYRRYHDTWSIDSDALSVGLSSRVGERFLLGGAYRRYLQTGAYFYSPSYSGNPQYYTGDFRLFPFNSDLYTGRVEITPERAPLGLPEGTALTLQYERYNATTGFQAGIITGSIRVPLK